jgi:hypothetical protein
LLRSQQTDQVDAYRPWKVGRGVAVLGMLVLLLVVALRQVDAGLARIEAPAHPTATVGALVIPGVESRTAWCVWAYALDDVWGSAKTLDGTTRPPAPAVDVTGDPRSRVDDCLKLFTDARGTEISPLGQAPQWRQLVWAYVVLDVLFACGYVLLLNRGLRVLRPSEQRPSAGRFPPSIYRATRPSLRRRLMFVLLFAEVVEAACLLLLLPPISPHEIDIVHWIACAAGALKWLCVAVAVVLLAFLLWDRRPRSTPWRRDVRALRLQLAVAALLLLLLSGVGTDQVQDALLGLLDNGLRGVATLASVVVLVLLLWRSVHRSALSRERILDSVPLTALWLACGAAALLAWLWFRNLWALAGLFAVVAALTWLSRRRPFDPGDAAKAKLADLQERRLAHAERLRALARVLAAFPLIVLAVFVVRAATASAVVGPRRGFAIALLMCSLVVAIAGVLTPYALRWAEAKQWSVALPPSENRGGNELDTSKAEPVPTGPARRGN